MAGAGTEFSWERWESTVPHTDIVWPAKIRTAGNSPFVHASIYSISVLYTPPESDLNEGRLMFNVLQGSRT